MIRKNIFSILIALVILYLSLANSKSFEGIEVQVPYSDKIVHFGMYFALMTSLLIENRQKVKKNASIFILGLIPLGYGILMEILQSFTVTRSPSAGDALADAAGILFSVFLWFIAWPSVKAKSE